MSLVVGHDTQPRSQVGRTTAAKNEPAKFSFLDQPSRPRPAVASSRSRERLGNVQKRRAAQEIKLARTGQVRPIPAGSLSLPRPLVG
jgi:hypothetical protein